MESSLKTLNIRLIRKGTNLYKRDRTGGIRKWYYEIGSDGESYAWRAISGLQDGAKVQSGWKVVEPKNVGRANATTAGEQARFEAEAAAKKKCDTGYFEDVNKIDTFTKFKPMLAYEYSKVKDIQFPVVAQPKLDGIRCIARADGLWTRAGKELVSVPHISNALKEFFSTNPDAILDGELYNHDLRNDFNKLSSLIRKTKPTKADIDECMGAVEYHVYDCYTDQGLEDRMVRLIHLSDDPAVIRVPSISCDDIKALDDLYGLWLEEGYEGQMVRIPGSLYEVNKRSKNLLKRKEFLDAEFKVLRVEEGVGNWAGYIKRFVLELPDGREFGSNVRGTQSILKELLESSITPDWATCRYFTPTPDGIPRFPVVTDWGVGERDD